MPPDVSAEVVRRSASTDPTDATDQQQAGV
jgi:hypothetical protein